jgi:hypothetical protein
LLLHAIANLERGDAVQVTMPKPYPYIKYKIISSSRSWDNCCESFHYSKHEKFYAITLSVRPFVCPSVRSHFHNKYLSFYWKKWFYIWYMALAWWLVPCLPFPGLSGETRYKSPCQSHISNIKSFLPVLLRNFSLQQTWKILSRTVNRK